MEDLVPPALSSKALIEKLKPFWNAFLRTAGRSWQRSTGVTTHLSNAFLSNSPLKSSLSAYLHRIPEMTHAISHLFGITRNAATSNHSISSWGPSVTPGAKLRSQHPNCGQLYRFRYTAVAIVHTRAWYWNGLEGLLRPHWMSLLGRQCQCDLPICGNH